METVTVTETEKIKNRIVYLATRRMLADRWWPKLGIEPHQKQKEVERAFLNGAQYILLLWGRRTGKTIEAAKLTIPDIAMHPPGELPFREISHTGPVDDTTNRVWGYYENWLYDKNLFGKRPKRNLNDKTLVFPWRARTTGKTTKREGGEPDHLLGEGIVGRIADEHARDKDGILDQFLMPPLWDTGGYIIIPTTPRGRLNHVYHLYKDWTRQMQAGDRRYFTSHATSFENPYLDRAIIKKYRDDLIKKGKEKLWLQEGMAEFTALDKAIYKDFMPQRLTSDGEYIPWHVQRVEYDPALPIYVGIDWGTAHRFCVYFGQLVTSMNGELQLRVFHEISEQGLNPISQFNAIDRFLEASDRRYNVEMIYPDPSGLGQIDILRENGLPVYKPMADQKTRLNSVEEGIFEVASAFARHDFPGIIIDPSCQKLIDGIQSYVRDDKSSKPVKENDDEVDALRYLFMGTIGLRQYVPEFWDY